MKIRNVLHLALATCLTLSAAPKAMALLELPDLLEAKIEAYQQEKEALLADRQELAESLRDMPARERREAIEAFEDQHAERLAAHRELGDEIRRELQQLRTAHHRPTRERPQQTVQNRPEPSPEVQQFTSNFNAKRDELLAQKQALLEEFKDASAEERQAALERWQEDRARIVAEIRQAAREIQQDIADQRDDKLR